MLGVVGHDVRTPLALVLGHLEELATHWDESAEEARLARVGKAFAAALRLSALIDDILAMANFDSGTIATRPIRVAAPRASSWRPWPACTVRARWRCTSTAP